MTQSGTTRGTAPAWAGRRGLGRWLDSPPPRVAVEIGAAAVIAAKARPGPDGAPRLAQTAILPLAAGTVTPAPAAANIGDPEALSATLRTALERVGGLGRDVVLLLPDLAVRVSLLEFDEIPHRAEEVAALVRFRLRKTLPFDAESAALSAQVLGGGEERSVLAVVAERARLEEYEAALERAGARAARVLPAGLAALEAAPQLGHGTLLLRQEGNVLTSAFAWREVPRLFRVVAGAPEIGYEDIYPSAAFFRDFCESRGGEAPAVMPAIAAFGVPADSLAPLRAECDWAKVSGGPAWLASLGPHNDAMPPAEAERLLAVTGALCNGQ